MLQSQKSMDKAVRKRSTRQLTTIYETLRDDPSHPSADEIFLRVRKTLPRISLGTVYRNLQRLVEEGKLRVLPSGGRSTRYDPVVTEHDHFICRQCGKIFDVLVTGDRQIDFTALVEQGFTIAAQSLSIHGCCRDCSLKIGDKYRAKTQFDNSHGRRAQRRAAAQSGKRNTTTNYKAEGQEEDYGGKHDMP